MTFTYAVCTAPDHGLAADPRHGLPIINRPLCECGYMPRELWTLFIGVDGDDDGSWLDVGAAEIRVQRRRTDPVEYMVPSDAEEGGMIAEFGAGGLHLRDLRNMLNAYFEAVDKEAAHG